MFGLIWAVSLPYMPNKRQSLSNKVQIIVEIRVVADHLFSKLFDSGVG